MPPSRLLSKKQRKDEEKRRERREREGERRRQHGEEREEGALGVPVGGAGGVERSQDPVTQTVPVSLGPTGQEADEEARAENPMTRIGRACVVPGSAGVGVEKRGRGRPKKNPLVDATTCPSAPGAGAKPWGDATTCPSAPREDDATITSALHNGDAQANAAHSVGDAPVRVAPQVRVRSIATRSAPSSPARRPVRSQERVVPIQSVHSTA